MNKEFIKEDNIVIIKDEEDNLSVRDNETEINTKLSLENLIENTTNIIKDKSYIKYLKEEEYKDKFRTKWYKRIMLFSMLKTIITTLPLVLNIIGYRIVYLISNPVILYLTTFLIVLISSSILSLYSILISEKIIIPRKIKGLNPKLKNEIKELKEVLNNYRSDLINLDSKKIESNNNYKEKNIEYKYVFNEELLNNPYEFIDIEKEDYNGFIKKRIKKY